MDEEPEETVGTILAKGLIKILQIVAFVLAFFDTLFILIKLG
jgi:hypothetical protein